MIGLAAVIAAATAAGVAAERRLGERAEPVARFLMSTMLWVLLPIVAFFNIADLDIDVEVGAGIAYGYASFAVCLGAAYLLGRRILGLSRSSTGALMLVAVCGNTGYLGLPFNAALFGFGELPDAVAYDTLVSAVLFVTVGFTIGAAFGTRAEHPRERALSFLTRNPPLWATAAALVAPSALAPGWAVDGSRALVLLMLPMGFFAVGVTLASAAAQREARVLPPPVSVPVAGAASLKLVLAPAIAVLLSVAVLEVPGPYLVQPAMASGLNTIVVANEYGLDRDLCAAVIAWTTALVVAAGLVISLV